MTQRLLALLLLALSPATHAIEIEGCVIHAPAVVELSSADINHLTPVSYHYIEVECEAGLPYQLELSNAHSGGMVNAHSHHPQPVPVFLVQSESRLPWGRADDGEAIGGVGTGGRVLHAVEAGAPLSYLPAPGRYTAPLDINIVF